jgi:stearoyl-CoA desaturase (delta-9 desaturase)
MVIPIVLVAQWYLSLFHQTFFLHRYSAHRMFTLNKFWERFFFVTTWITQNVSFLNPRAYAILHRLHHTYSDTDKDPHSPLHNRNLFVMMWRTRLVYKKIVERTVEVPKQFQGNYPEWNKIEEIMESNWLRLIWIGAWITFYAFFATSWWMWLFLPINLLVSPIQGAIVNWFGHKLGYQNHDNRDNSKNTTPVDVLLLGELFQNNHHKYPVRANFATRWWEFDPVYPVMRMFDAIGIIKLKGKKRKLTEEVTQDVHAEASSTTFDIKSAKGHLRSQLPETEVSPAAAAIKSTLRDFNIHTASGGLGSQPAVE